MLFVLVIDILSIFRERKLNIRKDLDNNCFICGLDRTTLDKIYLDKNGFKMHFEDHNLSSYFIYIFYLIEKEESERNGIEKYVYNCIINQSFSWYPIGRCLKMEEKLI
jgi:hypothetical protein